ncbi:MAG: aldehyde dehydrogenase [Bacteroidota bacterium]|nr:aldehyde dehydrogenase [Bacteroidota bacterium]
MIPDAVLHNMRTYFEAGHTQSYDARKKHLLALQQAIIRHEEAIYEALYSDLKKTKEEAWVTENGMVLAELKHTLAQLSKWMQPKKVGTNLLNFPSSSKIVAEPLGVVCIIGPWNYPFQLLINPLIGAIAAGNCAVLKPSEFAPATAAVIERIITAAFPKEYITVVQGSGETVVPQLLQAFTFDHIFYTGSTTVGKIIYKMAAEKLVPVTLELGGKSPCVVEADANIKVAAKRIAVTKFSNCGQMCVAPDYVLVHASKAQALIGALKNAIQQFYGPDAAEVYGYGKMINTKQFNRVASYLQEGEILYGGRIEADQLFIEPTLLQPHSIESRVMQDEIFGPVLPIITFENVEEAKAIIAQHKNPLAFYVFTSSAGKEREWLQAIPSGGACVNNTSWHLTNPNLPFGGRGFSGTGQYHGRYSFETFSHAKAVMKTPTWFDPALKYPPFKGKLNLFKKVIG